MRKIFRTRSGFSLVELIMAMLLAGIVGTMSTIGVISFARSFLTAKEGVQLAGAAQLAMLRLAKEFVAISSVAAGSTSAISFQSQHDEGTAKNYTISVNGTALQLTDNDTAETDTLAGDVAAFNLEYYDWDYDNASPLTPSSSWTDWPNSEFPLTLMVNNATYDDGAEELLVEFTDVVNGNDLDFVLTYSGTDTNCTWQGGAYQCTMNSAACYDQLYLWATTASGGGGNQSYVELELDPACTVAGADPAVNNPPPQPTGSGGTKLIKATLTLTGTAPFSITVAPRNI